MLTTTHLADGAFFTTVLSLIGDGRIVLGVKHHHLGAVDFLSAVPQTDELPLILADGTVRRWVVRRRRLCSTGHTEMRHVRLMKWVLGQTTRIVNNDKTHINVSE